MRSFSSAVRLTRSNGAGTSGLSADGSAGALRFLKRVDSIDDLVAPEVPPVYGTLVAFKRADNSFHGHLPFEGERRVIQVAWLTSLEEKDRKTRRGRFSRLLKRILGRLDGLWGAYQWLDRAPLGRNESGIWWKRHDEYTAA